MKARTNKTLFGGKNLAAVHMNKDMEIIGLTETVGLFEFIRVVIT